MVTTGKPDGRVWVGSVWLENVMLGADQRDNELDKHPQEKLEESHENFVVTENNAVPWFLNIIKTEELDSKVKLWGF